MLRPNPVQRVNGTSRERCHTDHAYTEPLQPDIWWLVIDTLVLSAMS